MQRIAKALEKRFGLKVRKIRDSRDSNRPIVLLDIKEFGIVLLNKLYVEGEFNYKGYATVMVDTSKLDNQIYVNSVIKETFWCLIKGGYLYGFRKKSPRVFRELMLTQGWGTNIIKERLENWGDEPKYRYLVEMNKSFLDNMNLNINKEPWFFDVL